MVVHRPVYPGQVHRGIVVAAEATEDSTPVLSFAFRQASLRRLPLRVAHFVYDARSELVGIPTMAGEHTFEAEVLTPEGEVFRGEVSQISTRTMTGEIGILANHAPVLAALKPTELRIYADGSEPERYAQSHGMMQVFANHAALSTSPTVGIDIQENGEKLLIGERVWTGTGAGGLRNGSGTSDYCGEWFWNGGGTPTLGNTFATDGEWTDSETATCGQNARLYCFEL